MSQQPSSLHVSMSKYELANGENTTIVCITMQISRKRCAAGGIPYT